MTRKIGIFLYPEVEVLDFAGPYEVFTCATRVARLQDPQAEAPFDVCTIAATREPVRARAGLSVLPDHAQDSHDPLDVLLIPGGMVDRELGRAATINWIARTSAQVPLTASVCSGALLLAQAGLLEGRPATTHWSDVEQLQGYPNVQVLPQRRWTDDGGIVTSGGISAGIDMALYLVQRFAGRELALATAHRMEYAWNEQG
ncbi:DJ-1/PfpI family protein [Pseudoduganella ginsengisoli]|uniref:DJ-1/PfpI family protein n=1 Tax=Pseudoduganella ginsengisoli TaxID=1462440 RepID=A0A6L6Q3L7_9BURK|nr:DJ-1/PfpI family protein [Pseudoduganella ginsengisoli]MTW04443.1 DJ-1/PfpI family protein [Pseudoduganella ginsengisoli]